MLNKNLVRCIKYQLECTIEIGKEKKAYVLIKYRFFFGFNPSISREKCSNSLKFNRDVCKV